MHMICKHIFLIEFLNKLISFSHPVKWFQVLLSNMNNYFYHELFVCTLLNGSKFCKISLMIQLNISHLFTLI